MARNWIAKELPPLSEVFSDFHGFKAEKSRLQTLTETVRAAAFELQGEDSRPFYSMREIATHFSLPLRTVAKAYEALDLEGVLVRIRGSQTMLAGRQTVSRQAIQAIVGLPISLQGMISSPFECMLQMELEERLRARGFVADSIFYRSNEECDPVFSDRLLRHRLDLVIWHSPHPLSSHVLMSLRDQGVRLVLCHSPDSPLRIPARVHLLEWREAYQQMAQHWCAEGIQRAVFPRPESLLSRRALRTLTDVLEKAGIEVLVVDGNENALSDHFLGSRTVKKEVLAFIDNQGADSLCNGYPDIVEAISKVARVAFCRGSVRVPRFITRRLCVDVVEVDPRVLAAGIVEDLCDPTQKHEGVRRSFQAEFHPRVIMGEAADL